MDTTRLTERPRSSDFRYAKAGNSRFDAGLLARATLVSFRFHFTDHRSLIPESRIPIHHHQMAASNADDGRLFPSACRRHRTSSIPPAVAPSWLPRAHVHHRAHAARVMRLLLQRLHQTASSIRSTQSATTESHSRRCCAVSSATIAARHHQHVGAAGEHARRARRRGANAFFRAIADPSPSATIAHPATVSTKRQLHLQSASDAAAMACGQLGIAATRRPPHPERLVTAPSERVSHAPRCQSTPAEHDKM